MYNVGDMVRVLSRQEKQRNQGPNYTDEMLRYVGLEFVISRSNGHNTVALAPPDNITLKTKQKMINIDFYSWHNTWLEPVMLIQIDDDDWKI